MSFNIRVATARDGPNRWELRREALLRTIQAHFPDLLGCQEVTPHQRQFLEERLSYAYGCRGEGRNSDGSGEQTTVFWRSDRLQMRSAMESRWFPKIAKPRVSCSADPFLKTPRSQI